MPEKKSGMPVPHFRCSRNGLIRIFPHRRPALRAALPN
jgi:hypothetical protein